MSTNHILLCERITRIQREQISALSKDGDDRELESEMDYIRSQADELRREATSFALVAVVTRFQHWVRLFVEELMDRAQQP